jgi:WXG100 family type VII secretion target
MGIEETLLHVGLGLEGAGPTIAAHAGTLESELTGLKNKLAPIDPLWTGQAKVDYLALRSQWETAANDLFLLLTEIATAVGLAHTNYMDAETANIATMRSGL